MKTFLLSLLLAGSVSVQAQNIKEWLTLTPIRVEKPAFSETNNVKDQTFTDAMLAEYGGLNVHNLCPQADGKEGSLKPTARKVL